MAARVAGDIPHIAEGIFDGGGAYAIGLVLWRLNVRGPGSKRLFVKSVGVGNVDVKQARHRLEVAVSFTNFERGTADFHGCVKYGTVGRFVETQGFGVESRFKEWNHLVSFLEMEVGLNRKRHSRRAESPASRCSDMPDVAEGVSQSTPAVAGRMIARGKEDGFGSGTKSARESPVNVLDIDMGRSGARRESVVGVADFDDGITNGDLGMHDFTVGRRIATPLGPFECLKEEDDELSCALDNEIGRDVRETRRTKIGRFAAGW